MNSIGNVTNHPVAPYQDELHGLYYAQRPSWQTQGSCGSGPRVYILDQGSTVDSAESVLGSYVSQSMAPPIQNKDDTLRSNMRACQPLEQKKASCYGDANRENDRWGASLETAKVIGAYGVTMTTGALLGGLSGAGNGAVTGFQWGEGLVNSIFGMHSSLGCDPKLRTAYQILSLAAGLVAGAGGMAIGLSIGAIKGAVEGFKHYQSQQAIEPAIAHTSSSAYQTRPSAALEQSC